MSSSIIDKKLEITKYSKIDSKLTKKLENRLEIFEIFVNFEFYFEIFVNFEFYFEIFVNFEFFVNGRWSQYYNDFSKIEKNPRKNSTLTGFQGADWWYTFCHFYCQICSKTGVVISKQVKRSFTNTRRRNFIKKFQKIKKKMQKNAKKLQN